MQMKTFLMFAAIGGAALVGHCMREAGIDISPLGWLTLLLIGAAIAWAWHSYQKDEKAIIDGAARESAAEVEAEREAARLVKRTRLEELRHLELLEAITFHLNDGGRAAKEILARRYRDIPRRPHPTGDPEFDLEHARLSEKMTNEIEKANRILRMTTAPTPGEP
jgi:hypothetical protein